MRRIIITIMLALCVILGLSVFACATVSDYDQGRDHGFIAGDYIGEIYGKDDFSNGKNNDWLKALPSNTAITDMFNLSRETSSYRSSFIAGFRLGFEEGYKNGFRWESNMELIVEPDNTGVIDGLIIGEITGQRAGVSDFNDGKTSDWKRELPSDSIIINDFNLNREVASYRGSFIEGFKKGFKTHYVIGFREANLNEIAEKLYEVEEYINISMDGGEAESWDGLMTVRFEEGTLYKENPIKVTRKVMAASGYSSNLLSATEHYTVVLKNRYIFPQKPFTLSFQYFGLKSAGIYQYVNNKWTYLTSDFKDNSIYTVIDAPYYRGGEYAVFIKRDLKEIVDIEYHWAGKELSYFNHLGYLNTNEQKEYKPDSIMLRGEFINMLDKVYHWSNDSKKNLSIFKDYSILGEYEESFSKAFGKGYISGYSDYTLRAHMPLTYQEVEAIMRKLLANSGFKWSDFSIRLQEDKGIVSSGARNTNNYISKAEAIYLLYNYR